MLYNILFLCISCISVPLAEGQNATNTTASGDVRNIISGEVSPRMMPRQTKKPGLEPYYEPYWEIGDWVYYRNHSTRKPLASILNVGNSTTHVECNQLCPKIYEDYSEVCGMKYNRYKWIYEYKSFNSLCYLELENCVSHSKRWFPVMKGNCTQHFQTQSIAHLRFVTHAAALEANISWYAS